MPAHSAVERLDPVGPVVVAVLAGGILLKVELDSLAWAQIPVPVAFILGHARVGLDEHTYAGLSDDEGRVTISISDSRPVSAVAAAKTRPAADGPFTLTVIVTDTNWPSHQAPKTPCRAER